MSVAGAAHRSEGGDEPGVLGWTSAGSLPRPPCPAFPPQRGSKGDLGRLFLTASLSHKVHLSHGQQPGMHLPPPRDLLSSGNEGL